MRAMQRILTGAFMVVLLTIVFVATACGKDQEIVRTAEATPVGTTTTEATPPPTTSTTVDPAAIESFLKAWHDAETTTTTTTTPPPPPTTVATTAPRPTIPPTVAPEAPEPEPEAPPAPVSDEDGYGNCVIPAYICQRESGNNPMAVNYGGCGGRNCYGRYQFDPRTWDGVVRQMGRYDLVGNYLPAGVVQDQVAAHLWAGGAGCGHWAAC